MEDRRGRVVGPRAAAPAGDPPPPRRLRAEAPRRLRHEPRAGARVPHAPRHPDRQRRPRGPGVRPGRLQAAARHRPHPPPDLARADVRRAPAPGHLVVRRRRLGNGARHPRPRRHAAERARRSSRRPRADHRPPRRPGGRRPRRAHTRGRHAAPRRGCRAGARPRPHLGGSLARRAHAARHRRHADGHQRDRSARAREQARARRQCAPLHARRHPPSPGRSGSDGPRGVAAPRAPRSHPRDRAEREGRAAQGRRDRRRPGAPAHGAARLPLRRHRAAFGAGRLGARRAARPDVSGIHLSGSLDRGPFRPRHPREARGAQGCRGPSARDGRAPGRVPVRTRRFALVRGQLHPHRGRTRRARPRRKAAHAGRAAPARARLRAHRADAHAAVPDGVGARVVPQAAAGHPRVSRPVQPQRLRASARRADRRALSAARRLGDERPQPSPPQAPVEGVRAPGRARARHVRSARAHPAAAHRVAAGRRGRRHPRGSARTGRRARGVAAHRCAARRARPDPRPPGLRAPRDAARAAARAHPRRPRGRVDVLRQPRRARAAALRARPPGAGAAARRTVGPPRPRGAGRHRAGVRLVAVGARAPAAHGSGAAGGQHERRRPPRARLPSRRRGPRGRRRTTAGGRTGHAVAHRHRRPRRRGHGAQTRPEGRPAHGAGNLGCRPHAAAHPRAGVARVALRGARRAA